MAVVVIGDLPRAFVQQPAENPGHVWICRERQSTGVSAPRRDMPAICLITFLRHASGEEGPLLDSKCRSHFGGDREQIPGVSSWISSRTRTRMVTGLPAFCLIWAQGCALLWTQARSM